MEQIVSIEIAPEYTVTVNIIMSAADPGGVLALGLGVPRPSLGAWRGGLRYPLVSVLRIKC